MWFIGNQLWGLRIISEFRFQWHGTQIKLVVTVIFFLCSSLFLNQVVVSMFCCLQFYLCYCHSCLVVFSVAWAFLLWSCEQHLLETILRSVRKSFTSTQCDFIGKTKNKLIYSEILHSTWIEYTFCMFAYYFSVSFSVLHSMLNEKKSCEVCLKHAIANSTTCFES